MNVIFVCYSMSLAKHFNRFIDYIVIYGSEYPFLQFVTSYRSFLYRYLCYSFEIFCMWMLFSNKTLWRISSLNRATYSQRMQEMYFTKIFKKKQHFMHVNINTRKKSSVQRKELVFYVFKKMYILKIFILCKEI